MDGDDSKVEDRRRPGTPSGSEADMAILADLHRQLVVLCIDNDPQHLHMVSELLPREAENLVVRVCDDPRDGLFMAMQPDVDVILLDQNMPGMSGMELLTELRRSSSAAARSVPVVMLSGAPQPFDDMSGGYVAWLRKPVQSTRELAHAVSLAAQCRELSAGLPVPGAAVADSQVGHNIAAVELSGDEVALALDSAEAMRHRVRSCLNAVSGYAQMIELDPAEATRQAGAIRDKVDEIVGVVDQYVWQTRSLLDREGS